MKDGSTRELKTRDTDGLFGQFMTKFQASLVILNGPATGTDCTIDSQRLVIGRGPGVDLALDDSAMSREHAALEFSGRGFQLSDLGSTNGVMVNGSKVTVADLKHADKIHIGEHQFQFVIEERAHTPTHVLPGK